MGGCISSHASTKDTTRVVLRILAEVNTLPLTDSTVPQQWKRLFHGLVPVTLSCIQADGEEYVYRVSASGVDGSTFSAHIRVPGTELHKTSPCFIQWEDGQGREREGGEEGGEEGSSTLCGLNFMSEEDAMKFLKGCTPPTLTPESKKRRYSLPVSPHLITPPPPPPSQDATHHRLSDSFESVESDTHSNQEFNSHPPIPESPDHQYGNETHTGTEVPIQLETTNFDTAMQPCAHTPIPPDAQVREEEYTDGEPTVSEEQTLYTYHDAVTETGGMGGEGGEVTIHGSEIEERERGNGIEIDVEGDEEGSQVGSPGGDFPTLYKPTAPLHLTPSGILHDIAEETECDTEFEHSWNVAGSTNGVGNRVLPTELEELEYAETNFLDNTGSTTDFNDQNVTEPLTSPGVISPPSLPVTPPPGPVLSPRLSMLLAEAAGAEGGQATLQISDPKNRLSTASLSGDVPPPPLPTSLPPGKLISPRHSLMDLEHGRGPGSTTGSVGMGLDFALLSQRVADMSDKPRTGSHDSVPEEEVQNGDQAELAELEKECNGDEEPLLITTIDEVDDPPEDICEENIPPPVEDETPNDFTGVSKLKITPSFLQTLEPPREFSDSGFPDTDHENVQSTPETVPLRLPVHHHHLPVGDKDGSTTASDERTTEYSGSATKNQSSTGDGATEERGSGSSNTSHKEEATAEEREGRKEDDTPIPTTRKTGWLELKEMLVRKNRKVAMKSKRRWRRFWAALRGANLLFSVCEDGSSVPDDMPVDMKFDLSLSLAHAVHDHVKRDFIFCLSTANGNTYYLQTTSVSEMEDWIAAIHSAAAIAMTKHTSKEEALQMIKSNIEELNGTIEKETQLKNLTELNLTTATDYSTKSMATKQLVTCTENIEKYNVEIYRLRCYLASLHGTELPNPQTLLASISKPTKLALGKVGVFSVASLHAIVSARCISSTTTNGFLRFGRTSKPASSSSPSKVKGQKSKTFPRSPEKSLKSPLRSLEISGPYPVLPVSALHSLAQSYSEMEETTDTEVPFSPDGHPPLSSVLKVITPGNRLVSVPVCDDMTFEEVLHICCKQRQVDPRDHFLRLRLERKDGEFECEIPDLKDLLQDQDYSHVELCQKWTHTVILSSQTDIQHSTNTGFGLILEPGWDAGGKRLETVMVSKVTEGGVADQCGVWEGDEVTRVNGRAVRDAGWVGTISSLDAPSVSLTLKTCHIEMPVSEVTNQIVESLICPAPPSSHIELSSEMIQQLTVPTPTRGDVMENTRRYSGTFSREQIDILLKDSHDLSKLLMSWEVQRAKDEPPSVWTQEDRLRKSAQDLVDTERDYVRLLHLLVERYLEPLQSENFISPTDLEILEGNIPDILGFQTKFLRGLEEALTLEMNPSQVPPGSSVMKHVMFGIAGTFSIYMEHFRMYSTFCASHYKIKHLLESGQGSSELKEFLEARNPRQDHSLSLPALFAKPIVRISRYPLFLNAMIDNTPQDSEERSHLTDVVEGMTQVANYINETQRVSEVYSSLFDTILAENSSTLQAGLSLCVSQLRYHGDVMWLNPSEEHRAGKTSWKKGQGPQTTCFVFASAIVLVCVERKWKRRASVKSLEGEVAVDDTKFRILLPSLLCSVHDLPDSDGVTNMWQVKYRPGPTANTSSSLPSPYISYLFRSQSTDQKSTMIGHIHQSVKEQCEMNGVGGGDVSPLTHSPCHFPTPYHPHTSQNSKFTHSPLHITRSHFSPSHSSPFHSPSRPRSNSQPHLPHYIPSPHPSPLHTHIPPHSPH